MQSGWAISNEQKLFWSNLYNHNGNYFLITVMYSLSGDCVFSNRVSRIIILPICTTFFLILFIHIAKIVEGRTNVSLNELSCSWITGTRRYFSFFIFYSLLITTVRYAPGTFRMLLSLAAAVRGLHDTHSAKWPSCKKKRESGTKADLFVPSVRIPEIGRSINEAHSFSAIPRDRPRGLRRILFSTDLRLASICVEDALGKSAFLPHRFHRRFRIHLFSVMVMIRSTLRSFN